MLPAADKPKRFDFSKGGWTCLFNNSVLVGPDNTTYGSDTDEYKAFMDYLWHQDNDKFLKDTPFNGWILRHETAEDPDGHVYTRADDEFWDLTKTIGLARHCKGL